MILHITWFCLNISPACGNCFCLCNLCKPDSARTTVRFDHDLHCSLRGQMVSLTNYRVAFTDRTHTQWFKRLPSNKFLIFKAVESAQKQRHEIRSRYPVRADLRAMTNIHNRDRNIVFKYLKHINFMTLIEYLTKQEFLEKGNICLSICYLHFKRSKQINSKYTRWRVWRGGISTTKTIVCRCTDSTKQNHENIEPLYHT